MKSLISSHRRDISCIPAAFGRTIPMLTSGTTDVNRLIE